MEACAYSKALSKPFSKTAPASGKKLTKTGCCFYIDIDTYTFWLHSGTRAG